MRKVRAKLEEKSSSTIIKFHLNKMKTGNIVTKAELFTADDAACTHLRRLHRSTDEPHFIMLPIGEKSIRVLRTDYLASEPEVIYVRSFK